jgi:hypothetical protein
MTFSPFPKFSRMPQLFRMLLSIENLHRLNDLSAELTTAATVASSPGALADQLLEELPKEVADDPLARVVSEERPGFVEDAIAGIAGIERVLELDELVSLSDQGVAFRHKLAFGAFRDLARLQHAGGCVALPFRARLRRLAFPGKLGDWLARVDFRRVVWLATHATDLKADPDTTALSGQEAPAFDILCFAAAIEAWSPTRPGAVPDAGIAADAAVLVDLGMQWVREEEVRAAAGAPPGEQKLPERVAAKADGVTKKWNLYSHALSRAAKVLGSAPPPLLPIEAFTAQLALENAEARCKDKAAYQFVSPRPR